MRPGESSVTTIEMVAVNGPSRFIFRFMPKGFFQTMLADCERGSALWKIVVWGDGKQINNVKTVSWSLRATSRDSSLPECEYRHPRQLYICWIVQFDGDGASTEQKRYCLYFGFSVLPMSWGIVLGAALTLVEASKVSDFIFYRGHCCGSNRRWLKHVNSHWWWKFLASKGITWELQIVNHYF